MLNVYGVLLVLTWLYIYTINSASASNSKKIIFASFSLQELVWFASAFCMPHWKGNESGMQIWLGATPK